MLSSEWYALDKWRPVHVVALSLTHTHIHSLTHSLTLQHPDVNGSYLDISQICYVMVFLALVGNKYKWILLILSFAKQMCEADVRSICW